jgi:hypothetical protein
VAQPTNESNAGILPEQELNPLLNPLLAAHMGRWAEVYFTSLPEKRAQAVSDLVRELANNPEPDPRSSQRDSRSDDRRNGPVNEEADANPSPRSSAAFEQPGPIGESETDESETDESRICDSCGHKNAPRQRFCGMCGTPLEISPKNPSKQYAEAEPITAEWDESHAITGGDPGDELESAADSTPGAEYHETPRDLPWSRPEGGPVEFSVLAAYESEPASHSYRLYVGVVVTILLGLLVYMTWRSNTAFWSSGTAPAALPQAAPAPQSESAATSEPPAAAPAEPAPTPNRTPAAAQKPAEASPQDTGVQDNEAINRRTKTRPAARIVSTAASATVGAAEQNGSEELASAERYLNAGPGKARDSRQASLWLWKAVAKQNLTATLLLSDLYLRGDGVTRSCDQARLLLDAAARKGATAAGERLRNLQAFGCR